MINNAAEAYKRQQIMTATPEALTLMLYNGALRFMKEGKEAMEAKEWEHCNNSLQKAQKIIPDFQSTLKMEYEIAKQLMPLYEYVYNGLVEANMKSDPAKVDECMGIITELRDAWAEAMKKARKERGVTDGSAARY